MISVSSPPSQQGHPAGIRAVRPPLDDLVHQHVFGQFFDRLGLVRHD
ncbi:hypothetical protein ABH940_003387 [Streptacidiphilus sp. BW17]